MRYLFVVLCVALLSACATKAWRVEKEHCDYDAILRYPTKYEQQLVTRTRSVEVPDGVRCVTYEKHRKEITDCTPKTRLVSELYQTIESVDVNYPVRESYATDCANQRCIEHYGNPSCEADKKGQ